jgi:tetratricopeptide (TPR) repeat protein
MKDLELIDDYFAGRLSPVDRTRFETNLQIDAAIAKSVAFYLLARQTARQESGCIVKPLPTRRRAIRAIWAIAASILLIFGLSWFLLEWRTSPSSLELAEQYLNEHYNQLPTTLDGRADSLKTGVYYFNLGKWPEAKAVFESILQREPEKPEALKFAGIVSLRLGNYDQAIKYFHQLGRRSELYANPGIFLEALTYLKRGRPMDKNRAENLLRSVIQDNLEGKGEAVQLVKRIND